MKRLLLIGAMVLSLPGCGSGDGPVRIGSLGPHGTGEMHGTIAGRSLTVRSAIGAKLQYTNGTSEGIILLSDATDLCTAIEGGTQPPNTRFLVIDMVHFASASNFHAPVAAGTLEVVPFSEASTPGDHAVVDFYQSNATCGGESQPLSEAVSGSIELQAGFTDGSYIGLATFTTDGGDLVEANTWASSCSPLAVYNWLNQALTCQ